MSLTLFCAMFILVLLCVGAIAGAVGLGTLLTFLFGTEFVTTVRWRVGLGLAALGMTGFLVWTGFAILAQLAAPTPNYR